MSIDKPKIGDWNLIRSPNIIDYTGFDLNTNTGQKNFIKQLLSQKHTQIKITKSDVHIIRTGEDSGYIIAYHNTNDDYELCYMVKYEPKYMNIFNTYVTELLIWRIMFFGDLYERDIFDYILSEFPIITNSPFEISSKIKYLWRSNSKILYEKNFKIGCYNMNNDNISWYDKSENTNINTWYNSNGENHLSNYSDDIQYIISN